MPGSAREQHRLQKKMLDFMGHKLTLSIYIFCGFKIFSLSICIPRAFDGYSWYFFQFIASEGLATSLGELSMISFIPATSMLFDNLARLLHAI
jgi:hypothetical protein